MEAAFGGSDADELTVYPLAFGQPRQEDLLEYLHSLLGTAMVAEDLADPQIRL